MKNKERQISVYADWEGLDQARLIGYLHANTLRSKEIFSFEYDNHWLKENNNLMLDPALLLLSGRQYAPASINNFGIFLDSSPDRWGRFLLKRREAQLAREEKRPEKILLETDYLLGVYDQHRMGALRFKTDPSGHFLDDHKLLFDEWMIRVDKMLICAH